MDVSKVFLVQMKPEKMENQHVKFLALHKLSSHIFRVQYKKYTVTYFPYLH